MNPRIAEIGHIVIAAWLVHDAGKGEIKPLGLFNAPLPLGRLGLNPQRVIHSTYLAD
jgi:hypothetical protein